jgi:AraC-like DNA-binding protein
MTVESTTALLDVSVWDTATGIDGFASLCCSEPHIRLCSDPHTFSLSQRVAAIGPVVVADVMVNSDATIHCGELCSAYRVNVMRSGRTESTHRGSTLTAGPGTAVVYQPEGDAGARWSAGSRLLGVKIDRCAVEEALGDALGAVPTSQIDFAARMSTDAAARSWTSMLSLLAEELFRPGGLLRQPLAALPFVDSLIHGLLLAADNPYRDAVAGLTTSVSPRAVRAAMEIMEAEAHLPLTVSAIASRCHASVRSLQQGFQRHVGMSPMAYLREVRLRHAHQSLLDSDPSVATVASIACHWGFTNLGRFAAAHTARYAEPPAATLRRRAFGRSR